MPVCRGAVMLSYHFLIGDTASPPANSRSGEHTPTDTHKHGQQRSEHAWAQWTDVHQAPPPTQELWLFFLRFSTLITEYSLGHTTRKYIKIVVMFFLKELYCYTMFVYTCLVNVHKMAMFHQRNFCSDQFELCIYTAPASLKMEVFWIVPAIYKVVYAVMEFFFFFFYLYGAMHSFFQLF